MGFVQRAFTPGGGEDPVAVQQRAEGEAAKMKAAEAAKAPTAPTLPTAPAPPPTFSPGQAPGQKQRAAVTASTMLGAAATGGEVAKAGATGRRNTLLGQ